jgi:hypothetical protein
MRRVPWVTEPELCLHLFACRQYITFHSASQHGFGNRMEIARKLPKSRWISAQPTL